jgi:hypothetical protein
MVKTKFNYVWSHISKSLKDFGELISPYVTGAGSDKLAAGDREVTLTDNEGDANLTFNPGTVSIETSGSGSDLYIRTLGGDDIILESGDDIRLQGDQGTYDAETEGGDINIYAGDGSDGDTANAGSGGDIRIEAGAAGNSVSGSQGEGGFVTIQGGYTTASGLSGGDVNIYGGDSTDNIYGNIIISGNFTWEFSTRNATLLFPVITLETLPNPVGVPGARAVIANSSVPALGNFGVTASSTGPHIVPVFSDGTNWLIG